MARINLEQLKTFLTVVRMGSISKAAVGLNLTQPAVTTRIKSLEESLSVKLFERSSGGLKLTKRGEMLIRYAEQYEHLSELVDENIIAADGIKDHLRLGVSETIAECWLPQFVSALHRHFPNLEIEINVDISINLRAALLDREVDLAILLGPISEYSVDNLELPDFNLAWYAAIETETGGPDDADLISQRPVITYARNTRPYREIKTSLFENYGPNFRLFPSSSLSACFRLVEAGLGVAALPESLGQKFVREEKLRQFDPGWTPSPLKFSASYLGDPKSYVLETAAKLALKTAQAESGI